MFIIAFVRKLGTDPTLTFLEIFIPVFIEKYGHCYHDNKADGGIQELFEYNSRPHIK